MGYVNSHSLYEILRSLWKHLISNACILSMSAVIVHVSQAYKKKKKKKKGHGQGTHQSDLGADGDVLVIPNDFLVWSLQQ